MPVLKQIKDFLSVHWNPGKREQPLLVACSGGPDSKALLYLLLESKKFFNLRIEVAHIDHGWRPESKAEAELLREEIEKLGLCFYLHTLKEAPPKEEAARSSRYAFLKQVGETINAQAILLGHQMEDQGETVLKRILEGASLPACGGMKPVSHLEGMPLWRPLLGTFKKDLIAWLEKRNISYIQDATNLSPRYLRGKMRTSILPLLEASFGKSIVKNLCRLGERAQNIELYLKKQVEPLWDRIEGSAICLSLLKDLDDVIISYFLKEWTMREDIRLSAQQLDLLLRYVRSKELEAGFQTAVHRLEIRQGKLALKKIYNYLNR
jgi:tRNA(Ile)-lysidine synthase